MLYKRLASAPDLESLWKIQVEMIDRFGLLPDPARNLLAIIELKLRVQPYGIKKIEAGPSGGRLLFATDTTIDPTRLITLIQTRPKEYKLDGGDKLRFFRDLADPAQRIEQVERVVEQLVG